jgi:hypothetical protein
MSVYVTNTFSENGFSEGLSLFSVKGRKGTLTPKAPARVAAGMAPAGIALGALPRPQKRLSTGRTNAAHGAVA